MQDHTCLLYRVGSLALGAPPITKTTTFLSLQHTGYTIDKYYNKYACTVFLQKRTMGRQENFKTCTCS